MKITDVRAMTLKGYKQWNYVQIETDEGLTGIGEAHPGAGISEIILQFKNRLVGADPRNIEPLYNRLIGAASNRYAMGLSAIGGIETALWDLLGKSLGVPVYQLLGGKYRDRIRLYADVGHGEETRRRVGHNAPEKVLGMATKRLSLTLITPQTNSNKMLSIENSARRNCRK